LLFAHSVEGDITPLLSGYFDTNIGQKMEKISYENILKEIGA
jgi:enolase-phosphatase E1